MCGVKYVTLRPCCHLGKDRSSNTIKGFTSNFSLVIIGHNNVSNVQVFKLWKQNSLRMMRMILLLRNIFLENV